MDLGTVRRNLRRGLYDSLVEVRRDLHLIFNNAELYNMPYDPDLREEIVRNPNEHILEAARQLRSLIDARE